MSSVNARVPPSRLAAIDSPADGEVAAYQASSGQFEWVANGSGGGGTVTSIALTESGNALTITGSPITGAGTFNIAGAGSSSQVILGDLTLGTLTSGTVTSVSSSQAFITITNPTSAASISIGNASASSTGVLTATDWTTFNSKGSGTVTSITAGDGLSGGTITGSGTIAIPNQGSVSAGAYTRANITVDARGIITDIANGGGGGTIGGSSTANQISFGDTTANEITSSGNLQFLSGQNLYVGGQIKIGNASGTKLTTVTSQNLILDTDDGSSSGSIVIEAGANGQISLTPNGTGTIKLDGVELDNSAIATGYILKASSATAAGWVAESGGGISWSTPVDANIIPDTDDTYDIGSLVTQFRNAYFDGTVRTDNLTVDSTASVAANITLGGGSYSTPSYAFIDDPDCGMGREDTNAIFLGTGGSPRLKIYSDGAVDLVDSKLKIGNSYGTDGQVLTSTGSGIAWENAGGGGGIGGSITDNQVAVGATTANEIEGYSDFTYNASTDTLTVGEKIDSSGTSQLELSAGSSVIAILDGGVANHINITPGSGRINAVASTLSVGTNLSNATISSRGAYDLTLNTNDGTSSGSITITDGANGNITLAPNGVGAVVFRSPRVSSFDTPASASAAGVTGSLAYDENYIYVCTATDTWKRVAIATW
eukprot:COSAG05_NODE_351_length_10910_cov_25.021645_8_plen_657_part_00